MTATTSRLCYTIVELEPDAYEDRVMWKGAEEMRESLERVLELLGHK